MFENSLTHPGLIKYIPENYKTIVWAYKFENLIVTVILPTLLICNCAVKILVYYDIRGDLMDELKCNVKNVNEHLNKQFSLKWEEHYCAH